MQVAIMKVRKKISIDMEMKAKQDITGVIEKYIEIAVSDKYSRYHSWDRCRDAFSGKLKASDHALELGFYLASWGMYRGSGGILQRNHLVHQGAVDVYFSEKFEHLKCTTLIEMNRALIKDILLLRDAIAAEYSSIYFKRGNQLMKPISTTDTLMSKVMLGTFGCVPAFDDFFIKGLKEHGIKKRKFNEEGLNAIFDFYDQHFAEINTSKELIFDKTGNHYPALKIVDMYFWQIGYDLDS